MSLCVRSRKTRDAYKEKTTYGALLKACAKKKSLHEGIKVHADIVESGLLEKNPYLASTLVITYVKCGAQEKAQRVLEQLAFRDVVSWSALISGYAKQGDGDEALSCFQRMQNESLAPNAVTFACILKACGRTKFIHKGKQIHEEIRSMGLLEKDIVLGTALVDMYAKCGELLRAQQVLDELPVRDVVAWSALIAGYVEEGQVHAAINCFEQMQREGLSPNAVTLTCILKACASLCDLRKGEEIHGLIVKNALLKKDIALGTALVDMYAKCGALARAAELMHKELRTRNIVSWSALISGYLRHGKGNEALNCFEMMLKEGLSPDSVTFVCILKVCGCIQALDKGRQIHKEVVSMGLLTKDTAVGNALIYMYVKCGALERAQQVLQELPIRDVVAWSTLIAGFAQQGEWHEAVACFNQMQKDGVIPNVVTFICILKACHTRASILQGKQIHEEIARRRLLEKEIVLGNALVDMYVKCDLMSRAREVLQGLPTRDVISWNSVLAGYARRGQCCEALSCFQQMQKEGIIPDAVTFACIMKVCGSIGALDQGHKIEGQIVNMGLLAKDIMLGNSLVDMYTKCGLVTKARQLLQELPARDAVSWNTLISGFAGIGHGDEAFDYFERMKSEGHSPDVITYVSVLRACGATGALGKGAEIHKMIVNNDMLKNDIILGNALIDMYMKCGMLLKAREVFESLLVRDAISYNVLISGCTQVRQSFEALTFFDRTQSEGLSPDTVTYICALKACASTGAINKGKYIHSEVVDRGLYVNDIILGNCLLDMYVKCGVLARAQQVLDELSIRDVVCFNALIGGYALQGRGYEALDCFERMEIEGISPDEVTFLSVLTACSHSGLFDEAEVLFWNMTVKHGIAPNIEHATCIIGVYGCKGHIDKAMEIVTMTPFSDNPAIWVALLGVCRKRGNVEVGKLAFGQAMQSDKNCAAAYTLMANIFAGAGMQEDAMNVEAMRLKYAPLKEATPE